IYESKKVSELIDPTRNNIINNVGLLFERFPLLWTYNDLIRSLDKAETQEETEKTKELSKEFLKQVVKILRRAQIHNQLTIYHNRILALVRSIGGRSFELKTKSRFVTGLGATHPSETGFRWDRNLGIPVIPSSSLKGVLRTWYKDYSHDSVILEWLGPEHSHGKDTASAGSLILFDAIPRIENNRAITLDLDILNPHYSNYYSNPEKNPPADYYSPVPVFFLTVASNTRFLFHIAPRPNCTVDLGKVEVTIREALGTIGIGAKTSVGYGQFISR
ncbi:MAG: type III-B CRISPR module RAMP protein Cmr6, partial [Candidatus Thorarchaeota archaeon]